MAEYLTELESGRDYLLFRSDGEYGDASVRDHGKQYRDKLKNVRLLGRFYVTADCGGFYTCMEKEKRNGKRSAATLSVQKNDLVSKNIIAVPCGSEMIFPIPVSQGEKNEGE